MSILKNKLNNKVKTASDKTKTKQKNLYFTRKIWHQSIIRLGNNYTTKPVKLKHSLTIIKNNKLTIKVTKTMRNQRKNSTGLRLPMILCKGSKN